MMAVACGGFFPAAATAQSYQLVTSTSDLESGKRYLIVAEYSSNYYAWAGLDLSDKKGKVTSVSAPNENVITSTNSVVPVQIVYVKEDKDKNKYWKIIDTETEEYVGVTLESSTYKLVGGSVVNDNFLWSIDGGKVQNCGHLSCYLKFNYNLGNSLFSIYDQSGGTEISLYKETGSPLILHNDKDNTTAISEAANANKTYDVILENRMLSKDGKWNTLCLPFDYSKTWPLADATIMELDVDGYYDSNNNRYTQAADGLHRTGFDATSSTLYLFFKTAESIEAGKPYIIKWEGTSGTIDSPTFSSVTISNTTIDVPSQDGYVTFKGGYNVKPITGVDQSILFLGSNNNVYYPSAAMNINAFRAYFQLNGLTAGEPYSPESGTGNGPTNVRAFALSFGDNETSSIENVQCSMFNVQSEVWYTLDGCRLDGKPTARGIYVNSGRKVVVK